MYGFHAKSWVQSWFHQIRDCCFSQSESPSCVFCIFLFSNLCFHVSFTEERLPSGHSAIKPSSVECCSDTCICLLENSELAVDLKI